MAFSKIGIIGTGVMGCGIAEQAISRSFDQVVLVKYTGGDPEPAKKKIEANLTRRSGKETNLPMLDVMMGRLQVTNKLSDLSGCEIVIEAIAETHEAKQKLMKELVLGPDVVVGTNTSTISVAWVASQYAHEGQVIGAHFMNPVPGSAVKGAEVIGHSKLADGVFQATMDFMISMGKTPSPAFDSEGFTVNRCLFPMIGSGIWALDEAAGVISAAQIDAAMKSSANLPMGPLELADLVGLDITLEIMRILKKAHGDRAVAVPRLLQLLVDRGEFGRKSGLGFYDYSKLPAVPRVFS